MIKRFALIILIIICATILTGCNTIHGLGKDIESVGHAMKNSSDKE